LCVYVLEWGAGCHDLCEQPPRFWHGSVSVCVRRGQRRSLPQYGQLHRREGDGRTWMRGTFVADHGRKEARDKETRILIFTLTPKHLPPPHNHPTSTTHLSNSSTAPISFSLATVVARIEGTHPPPSSLCGAARPPWPPSDGRCWGASSAPSRRQLWSPPAPKTSAGRVWFQTPLSTPRSRTTLDYQSFCPGQGQPRPPPPSHPHPKPPPYRTNWRFPPRKNDRCRGCPLRKFSGGIF